MFNVYMSLHNDALKPVTPLANDAINENQSIYAQLNNMWSMTK